MRNLMQGLGVAALAAVCSAAAAQSVDLDSLRELSRRATYQQFVGRQKAYAWARMAGQPIRFYDGETVVEIVGWENGRPIYNQTENADAAISISADRVLPGGPAGLTLNGSGMTVGVWDSARAIGWHQEFGGRVTSPSGQSDYSQHATHVTGTIAAAGVDALARGMAPTSSVHSYDWTDDLSEMAAAAAGGLQLSNHSYGRIRGWQRFGATWYWYGDTRVDEVEDFAFGHYSQLAADWDALANAAPNYLIFKSAGNDRDDAPSSQPISHRIWDFDTSQWVSSSAVRDGDGGLTGYDTLGNRSVAKNIMTIGAVDDVPGGYSGPSSVVMPDFSSFGPTDDGRIKPDLVANGVTVYSTDDSSSDYVTLSGTSMSSPSAAGGAALLVQHWKALNGGMGLSASALKALLIHTADECGDHPGPDFRFGWGLMNIEKAAKMVSRDSGTPETIQELSLANSDTRSFQVSSDGMKPLRVTIAWNDPAGNPKPNALNDPSPALVNDLDLKVIGPGGDHLPWTLNSANPAAGAANGVDSVNNVEQVVIETPAEGDYTIHISHKGTLSGGSQLFGIVTTGIGDSSGVKLGQVSFDSAKVYNSTEKTTATVSLLEEAPEGGVMVNLKPSNPLISMQETVLIPEGEISAEVEVDVNAPTAVHPWGVRILASYNGQELEDYMTIHPIRLIGSATTGTVAFGEDATFTVFVDGPAPPEGIEVDVLSTRPGFVDLPSSTIRIEPGETSASVTVTTSPFFRIYFVWLRASLNGYGKSARLNVGPW